MQTATVSNDAVKRSIASGRRQARRRELLLGLLFIAPAAVVTFLFGLYPVLYGFAISLQGGLVLPEGFIGLLNYVEAIGSLAYLVVLAIAASFFVVAYRLFRTPFTLMQQGGGNVYWYLVPGTMAAISTLYLLGLAFAGALTTLGAPPLALLIAAIVGFAILEGQQHGGLSYGLNVWGAMLLTLAGILMILFDFSELRTFLIPSLSALGQATTNYIVPLDSQFIALVGAVVGIGAIFALQRIRSHIDHHTRPNLATLFGLLRWVIAAVVIVLIMYILGALELLRASLTTLGNTAPEKLAGITSLSAADLVQRVLVWPQVFTILLGALLIGLAALVWLNAARRQTTLGMLSAIGVAVLLMVGGWLFIGQLPEAAAQGDPAFYQSLLRTATYAVVTVPVQLGLGLLLSYLLFYEIGWGKSFYRVVFFIPYIAPVVATAAMFAVIFSLDKNSLANQIMHLLGLPTQQWLRDTRGIFEIIAQQIGGRQTRLPAFLVGPSLPLVSAILYSIWVFSGYDAVIFLAGLGAVPHDLIEAAQVDGAGRWANFRHVIFPLISPTTFFLSLLAIIGTFKAFDSIYVLRLEAARGAMDTATVYIFELIRVGSKSWSYASSAAFILFGIILILTLIQNRVSQERVFYG